MQENDFYLRCDIAKTKSKGAALKEALACEVDASDFINIEIPNVFGERWKKRFTKERERLIENYPTDFDNLIVLSQRSYIYSIVKASCFMLSMFSDVGGPKNEFSASLTTPQGYADNEGWAYTLFNGVCADIEKPKELLNGTGFENFPQGDDLLTAIAIVWFFDAAQIRKSNESTAMNILFEAADALDLANGLRMWDEGAKDGIEKPAAALAKLRHSENYAMIAEAIKYWREKIDPAMSASKAADELVRKVPLSHKKLAELVSAEKKRQSR